MKKIIAFGIVCGVLFSNFFSSCKENNDVSFSILTYEKDSPIIEEIYANGTIYYTYLESNANKFKIKLSDSVIDNINNLVNDINFNNLDISNSKNIEKQHSEFYNVYFYNNNKLLKKYYFYNNVPLELKNLIKYLLSLRNLPAKKIDTIINFETRNEVKIVRLPPPPMPDPNDTIIDLDNIEKDFILNKHYNEKDTLLPKHELIHKKK